jgi:hypothetical protein
VSAEAAVIAATVPPVRASVCDAMFDIGEPLAELRSFIRIIGHLVTSQPR